MRPTHSCGEVSDGSSSSHGIAQAGRPFTAAKPRSTGEWPTVRLMQERATSFGSSRSKSVRSCGGPRTQPQVARENGASTFAAAASARRRSSTVAFTSSSFTPSQVQPSGVQSQK